MHLATLRYLLATAFNMSELRDLCFDLSIDSEMLTSGSKGDLARELVASCARQWRASVTSLRRPPSRPSSSPTTAFKTVQLSNVRSARCVPLLVMRYAVRGIDECYANATTHRPPNPPAALAAIFGKDTSATIDWQSLMQEGVIVRVRVSFWRPRMRLDLADLRLPTLTADEDATMRGLISLGSKRLLPDALYRDLFHRQRRIYRTLETFTYTTSWGSFIPLKAFREWEAATKSRCMICVPFVTTW